MVDVFCHLVFRIIINNTYGVRVYCNQRIETKKIQQKKEKKEEKRQRMRVPRKLNRETCKMNTTTIEIKKEQQHERNKNHSNERLAIIRQI